MKIRAFRAADEAELIDLWNRCDLLRPWNDPSKDIQRKSRQQGEMFLVGIRDRKIVASVMAGYDGHRGWVNYLAVAPEHRHEGLGRDIMAAAEQLLIKAGCPKINLQIRGSNKEAIAFYRRIGYLQDDVLSFGKRLEQDDAGN